MVTRVPFDHYSFTRCEGYGHEGAIFRVDKTSCIKVYAAHRTSSAQREYNMLERLSQDGVAVPLAYDLFAFEVPAGGFVLPSKETSFGAESTRLHYGEGTVLRGIHKEWIPGKVFGSFLPFPWHISGAFELFSSLYEKGYSLRDPTPENFVARRKGVSCIDASHIFVGDSGHTFKEAWRTFLLDLNSLHSSQFGSSLVSLETLLYLAREE